MDDNELPARVAVLAEIADNTKTTLAEIKADLRGLATKADLTAAIAPLATKVELAELKAEMFKWLLGGIGLQTIVIIGAAVTLARLH